MEIRQAILMAADHIERYPHEFNFMASGRPDRPNCGTPGCALGWISTFAIEKTSAFMGFSAACPALGIPENDHQEFYCRLSAAETNSVRTLGAWSGSPEHWAHKTQWHRRPDVCAHVLRLYANKYHPAEAPSTLDPAFIAFRNKFADAFSAA